MISMWTLMGLYAVSKIVIDTIYSIQNKTIDEVMDANDNFRSLPVGKFVHSDSGKSHHSLDSTTESNLGILLSAGILCP